MAAAQKKVEQAQAALVEVQKAEAEAKAALDELKKQEDAYQNTVTSFPSF